MNNDEHGHSYSNFSQEPENKKTEYLLNGIDKEAYFLANNLRTNRTSERLSHRLAAVSGNHSLFKKIGIILFWYMQPILYRIGFYTRSYLRFFFNLFAVSYGVCRQSISLYTWRRTVRFEFKRTLSQVVSGGLFSTIFTASLIGLAVVSQAVYWLGATGLTKMTAPILITVILREAAPILVGMIIMGRNGILTVSECSRLAFDGQLKNLVMRGIDPFIFIIVPRIWAFTLGCFSLGILFSLIALLMGYIATYVMGVMHDSIWTFYAQILLAMSLKDYIFIPLKFIVIGFVIGVGASITGMNARVSDDASTLIPKGFTRGILLILVVNILFTLEF